MRTDWDQVPVRRLVDYYIGGGWGKEEIDDTHTEGAFVVRGTDLPSAQFGDVSGVPYRYHKPANLSSRRLRPNDIVFEVSGGSKDQPVGRALLISESLLSSLGDAAMCASFCKLIRIDPEVASARFFFYYLSMIYNDRRIMEYQTQSTGISNFKFEAFLDGHHIPLPPREIQMRVAAVLAAYDELIENNLRRIEVLEEMARAVYREWFVNFRFPGHEDVALVESPIGPIPEEWEVLVLEHVVSTLESGSRPRGGIDPNETGVPSVGAENVLGLGKYDYSKDKYISRSFFESMRRGHVRSGDVLLYKDGAKLGRKSLFRDGFPHPECAINEHVFLLRTNGRVSQTFLYFWLDLPVNTQRIIDLNSNAAQPGISQPKVLGLPILAPPVELVKQFDAVTEPLLALLFNLARQNRNLATTRDLLLPRLVSGEIDVSEMEIDTEWLAS